MALRNFNFYQLTALHDRCGSEADGDISELANYVDLASRSDGGDHTWCWLIPEARESLADSNHVMLRVTSLYDKCVSDFGIRRIIDTLDSENQLLLIDDIVELHLTLFSDLTAATVRFKTDKQDALEECLVN